MKANRRKRSRRFFSLLTRASSAGRWLTTTINDMLQNGFRLFFNAHYKDVLHFCIRMVGTRLDAEEIALTAFQSTFANFSDLVTESNKASYLYTCSRNGCLNYLKARKRAFNRFSEYMQDEIDTQLWAEVEVPIMKAVFAAIDQLPTACREIFKLAYIDGLTDKEICDRLGITGSTLYVQRWRGIAKIKKSLGLQ